jgi:hypothetical protein
MKFPYTPTTNLFHKWGGVIKLVHGITHQQCRARAGRSLDGWWFDCDVEWRDTGKVSRSPVEPFKIVADEGAKNADIAVLSEAMNDYLLEHGEWYDTGPHEGWYAHRKKRVATTDAALQVSISRMSALQLLQLLTTSPEYMTDRYYHDFGVAVRTRMDALTLQEKKSK